MTDSGLLSFWKTAITSFVESAIADPGFRRDLQRTVGAAIPTKEAVATNLLTTVTGNRAISERAAAFVELLESATTLKGEVSKKCAGERALDREVAAAGRRISRWRRDLMDVVEQVIDSRYDRSLAELVTVTRVLLAVTTKN